MTDTDDAQPAADPVVLAPRGGEAVRARGTTITFKAVAADTAGAFSLLERTLPPGGRRPPPHVHPAAAEAFYVLDGAIEVVVGTRTVHGEAGAFVLVPGGVAHTFGNAGDRPARVLVLHAPAMDAYFRDLHALWSGAEAPSRDDERALMRRHGMHPAEG